MRKNNNNDLHIYVIAITNVQIHEQTIEQTTTQANKRVCNHIYKRRHYQTSILPDK